MPFDAELGALQDILRHIDLARDFAAGLDQDAFAGDTLRVYGVVRCLEIISEASRRLSEPLKARNPEINWRQIAGAGNVYRHDYEDVAARRVWDTLQIALPVLRTVVERELVART